MFFLTPCSPIGFSFASYFIYISSHLSSIIAFFRKKIYWNNFVIETHEKSWNFIAKWNVKIHFTKSRNYRLKATRGATNDVFKNCCLFTALVLTYFHQTKSRATFFRPETVVASFLHLMVLYSKWFSTILQNTSLWCFFFVLLKVIKDMFFKKYNKYGQSSSNLRLLM